MTENSNKASSDGEILLYQTPAGDVQVQCLLQNETIWLSLNRMAALFDVDKSGISRHLKNIFETGELNRDSVVAIFATTAADGKTYQVEHYNLDAIISVGYRVNSIRGTQFRIWATKTLKEFITKGFVLDDERLKQGGRLFGKDYFDELLERIREIRASERRFYQKITDWAGFLDQFLKLSRYPILEDKGKVSALEAKLKAEQEYEVFRRRQDHDYLSDFDREIKRLKGGK